MAEERNDERRKEETEKPNLTRTQFLSDRRSSQTTIVSKVGCWELISRLK